MENIKIVLASKNDKKQLLDFFQHYKIKTIIQNRIDCYLSHNFTVVAKDKNKIVGILQWYVKEDPKSGVVEFEEICVSENYRGRGIGSLLMKYAIQSVKNYFKRNKIEPRKIFLFVSEENKAGRGLYEKYGFKLTSEAGNLFSDTEKELLYCLNFY